MTNKYFNKFHFGGEQALMQSLITEAIQIYGIDVIYVPRNLTNFDHLYLTDDQSTYSQAIRTTVYLQSVDGFGPQQNIFTKFGLEIRDNITVCMSTRIFETDIQPKTHQDRPMEGDLIYFDLNKKVFQCKFTNNKEIFYELGKLPTYQLTCELFAYSDETFNTGVPEIDAIQSQGSLNILDHSITQDNTNNIITTEGGGQITIPSFDVQNTDPIAYNDEVPQNANNIIDESENNAFGFINVNEEQ
jgi:Virus neck protein